MFHVNWRVFSAITVLSSGLISCNHGNRGAETKIFHIPEPVWERKEGPIGFRSDDQFVRSHDLTDVLSFESGPKTKVEVTSRCTQGADELGATASFEIPGRVPLFAMLPRKFVEPGRVHGEAPLCGLRFLAQSEEGSVHRFSRKAFQVTDDGSGYGMEASRAGADYDESELQASNWTNTLSFSLSSGDPEEYHLICEGFELKTRAVRPDAVLLNEFDFSSIKNLRAQPDKKCRIAAVSGGTARLMSVPFRLHFHPDHPNYFFAPSAAK